MRALVPCRPHQVCQPCIYTPIHTWALLNRYGVFEDLPKKEKPTCKRLLEIYHKLLVDICGSCPRFIGLYLSWEYLWLTVSVPSADKATCKDERIYVTLVGDKKIKNVNSMQLLTSTDIKLISYDCVHKYIT